MTVEVQWDADPVKTGLADPGSDSKVYEPGATSGTVTVTDEAIAARTATATFDLPLPVAAITADKTTVDSSGDATERTVTIDGSGFPASSSGEITLRPGAPGSGGTPIVTQPVTVDAAGAFTGSTIVVPADQAAGDYHLVATIGSVIVDNTALTVTNPVEATITPTPTTVDSTGVEADRTITVTGSGFETGTGTLVLNEGAPGSGGPQVASVPMTADAAGDVAATDIIVPANQLAGDYHLVATVGATSSDNNAITVTGGAGPVMDTPAGLAEGTVTTTTIPVTWTEVTTPVAAESYVVRWAPTGTTTWTELAPVAVASDTVTGLTADTTYDIQVKAQATDHTDSDWSATLTATTAA